MVLIERTRLEIVLQRDRAAILAALASVTLVAWTYLFYRASTMTFTGGMDMAAHMAMPQLQSWGAIELLLLFFMWAVMMVAMMLPSAAPLLLLFARAQREKTGSHVLGSAAVLLAGYVLVWTAFSVLAALAQSGLHHAALLSPMMVSTSSVFSGLLFLGAGVFQYTPLKRACLARCRSPLSFLMGEWRTGQWGALLLGFKHGAYCVGCCWMLMGLLFIAGVMNLLWVAAIAALLLVEKAAPKGELVGRLAGGVLIAAGIAQVLMT
jgi:predicted metal-binding membrane protein